MGCILIAIPYASVAREMAEALEQDGHEVVTCIDGLSVMREVARNHPDLVVADVALKELDAFDLLRALEMEVNGQGIPSIIVRTRPAGDEGDEEWAWMGRVISPEQLRAMVAARLVVDLGEVVRGRVLVVDDDASLRTSLHVRLRMEGVEVSEAIDGIEALERVRDEIPDLVLTDVDMPRLDGFGLLKQIREHPEYRTIPVIVMTAHARQAEEAAFGLEQGANDYVRKPFDWLELMARVRTQLRAGEAHRLNVEKQRDLAIIELAGAAAHEINNPLAVGFTRLELMIADAKGSPELTKNLEQMESLLQRIADIVQKMSHVRRYQAEHYCGGVNILDLDAAAGE